VVVERYLEAVAGSDWDEAATCLTPDVTRVGPFHDRYRGREPYLAYLRALMPTLQGYRMDLGRIITSGDGRSVTVELSETVEMGGQTIVTPEVLVFDLDGEGLIGHIGIYIRTEGPKI
jgi:ketosteroid isomerase-like protein